MSQVEMFATYFIHDGADTSKWRLKGHGQKSFRVACNLVSHYARP